MQLLLSSNSIIRTCVIGTHVNALAFPPIFSSTVVLRCKSSEQIDTRFVTAFTLMSAFAGAPALQIEIIPYIVCIEAECDNLILYRKLVAACYNCFAYSKMSDEDFSRNKWQQCVFVPWRWYCYDAPNGETNHFDTKEMPDYFPMAVRHKAKLTLTNALEVRVITGVQSAAFDARRQGLKRHRSRSQRTEFKCHNSRLGRQWPKMAAVRDLWSMALTSDIDL